MRVFQTFGTADALLPNRVVSPGMRLVDASARQLIDWSRPRHIGAQGWAASYRFHQPDLEHALRQHLAQQANVELRLRQDASAIEPHAESVDLRLEVLTPGRLRRTRARYGVAGCGLRQRRWSGRPYIPFIRR